MATALALRLARMDLLGSATPAQLAGWRIAGSDGAIDLQSCLERALSGGSLDPFFEAERPQHPDYTMPRRLCGGKGCGVSLAGPDGLFLPL